MRRPLRRLRASSRPVALTAVAAAVVAAAAAATLAGSSGCAVSSLGLDIGHDAATDDPGAGDAPVDLAPDDAGPDLACGPCDVVTSFIILPGGRFTGTTAGTSAPGASNQGSCGGADAPEAVFKIELNATSDLFATTHGTGFDTVLYLRRGCCGDEVACNDDADGRHTSVIAAKALAAGTYYLYVDGAGPGDAGDFTLDVYANPTTMQAADTCGNPAPIAAAGVTGNTCDTHDDYSPPPGCSSAVSGPNGFDQVYYFVLDAPGSVTFSTCDNTCIDTVLYLRDVCSDSTSRLGCDDDACRATGSCLPANNQVQSVLTATLGAGVHYLVLDTFAATPFPCGTFTITPTGIP